MLQVISEALIETKYEWQLLEKEMKLKCRTKLHELEVGDHEGESDSAIEMFIQKNFIKFQIQIFKWSKELPDLYMVDFLLLKAGPAVIFLDQMDKLIRKVASLLEQNPSLQLMPTVTIQEETNPSRGQGFEVVPISPLQEQFPIE
jgi:hypothetical protein